MPATDERAALLNRLERCYDAMPRSGTRVEGIGPFVLFLAADGGHPWYARPELGAAGIGPADIAALRERQRALGVPEALEWVEETTPGLLAAAHESGLSVHQAPLMVLDGVPGAAPTPTGTTLRALDPATPGFAVDLSAAQAVADLAFRTEGTAVGAAGPTERDAMLTPLPDAVLAAEATQLVAGGRIRVLAENDAGPVSTGTVQLGDGGAEVVGVGTLPAARRHGLGLALTAELARLAGAAGADPVFLSADSDTVARIYARIGFRHIGTACVAAPPA